MRTLSAMIRQHASVLFWTAVILIFLSMMIRIAYDLSGWSYWLDEAFNVVLARRGIADLILMRAYDPAKPPLYFVGLHIWMSVFGEAEHATRSLSLVGYIASMIVFIPLVFRVIHGWVPRLSAMAGLMILAPVVRGGMQATYYIWALFWSLPVYFSWYRMTSAPTRRDCAVFVAASAILLFTHYAGIFLVGPALLYLLVRYPRYRFLRWGAVFLAGSLVLHIFFRWYAGATNAYTPITFYLDSIIAQHLRGLPMTPGMLAWYMIPDLPVWAQVPVAGGFAVLIVISLKKRWLGHSGSALAGLTLVMAALITLPVFGHLMSNEYYLGFLWPGMILTGVMIIERARPPVRLLMLVLAGCVLFASVRWNVFTSNTPDTHYHEMAVDMAAYSAQFAVIYDCSQKIVLEYYLVRNGADIHVDCFTQEHSSSGSGRVSFIAPVADKTFWSRIDSIISSRQWKPIREQQYDNAFEGQMRLLVGELGPLPH